MTNDLPCCNKGLPCLDLRSPHMRRRRCTTTTATRSTRLTASTIYFDNVSYCGLFNSFFGWARWFDLPIQMGLRWHQRVGVWICSDAMHDMRGTTCLEMQCCMDWGQPKTWIEKFSRPGLAKIATAICASASLWLGQRLLWWHIVSRWKRKQAAFHLCNISREGLPPVISRPICILPCVQNAVVMFGLFIGL